MTLTQMTTSISCLILIGFGCLLFAVLWLAFLPPSSPAEDRATGLTREDDPPINKDMGTGHQSGGLALLMALEV